MGKSKVLNEATLAPTAARYKTLSTAVAFAASIIGIPVLPLVVPVSAWYWKRYYARLRVILTSRDLMVHRGILVTEEKSIPLEKITDLALFQGPIMRKLGLKGIRVETAGQTSGGGALVTVIGIEDTDAFRDQVLRQRDRIADADFGADAVRPAASAVGERGASMLDSEILGTLRSVDGTLKRIEKALSERSGPPIV